MRYSKQIAVVAALAVPFASAQSLSSLPSCALQAASSGISDTGCATTDYHCLCSASSFLTALQGQVATQCSAADYQTTLTFAKSVCASVGITLSMPSSNTDSNTVASPATAAADHASATSAALDSSAAPTAGNDASTTPSSGSDSAATSAASSTAVSSNVTMSSSVIALSSSPAAAWTSALQSLSTSISPSASYLSAATSSSADQPLSPSISTSTSYSSAAAWSSVLQSIASGDYTTTTSTSTVSATATNTASAQQMSSTTGPTNMSSNTTVATSAPIVPFEGKAASQRLRWTGVALMVGTVGAFAAL